MKPVDAGSMVGTITFKEAEAKLISDTMNFSFGQDTVVAKNPWREDDVDGFWMLETVRDLSGSMFHTLETAVEWFVAGRRSKESQDAKTNYI